MLIQGMVTRNEDRRGCRKRFLTRYVWFSLDLHSDHWIIIKLIKIYSTASFNFSCDGEGLKIISLYFHFLISAVKFCKQSGTFVRDKFSMFYFVEDARKVPTGFTVAGFRYILSNN